MSKLLLAAALLVPLPALADVVKITCADDVYEIDRDNFTATSIARPDAEATISLIGRNLVEVLWTYPERGIWEREMFALHTAQKMSTGELDSTPADDQTYVLKEKCLKKEVLQ